MFLPSHEEVKKEVEKIYARKPDVTTWTKHEVDAANYSAFTGMYPVWLIEILLIAAGIGILSALYLMVTTDSGLFPILLLGVAWIAGWLIGE